jgi:hypothetical protein
MRRYECRRRVGMIWFVGALASMVGTVTTTAAADTDPDAWRLEKSINIWKNVNGQFEFDDHKLGSNGRTWCADVLKDFERKPSTVTFTLTADAPGLKAGTHPWTAARPVCDQALAIARRMKAISQFARSVGFAQDDAKNGSTQDNNSIKWCLQNYDEAIEAGVSPTYVATEQGMDITMKAARDWCAERAGALNQVEEARVAPLKKVLKNDKLDMAIKYTDYLFMPGRVELTPQRAAKFNVWFKEGRSDDRCPDGRNRHTLTRYQFDAQQKLQRVTDKEFCGPAPASALR